MAIKRNYFRPVGPVYLALLLGACSADGTSAVAIESPDGAVSEDTGASAPDDTLPDAAEMDTALVDEPDTDEPRAPCIPTDSFFVQKIWAPVMATTCIACHSSSGAAKATRMVLRSESWPGWLDYNLGVLREISNYD